MSDLGPLSYFLGVVVTRSPSYMLLSQQKYAQEILERGGMDSCKRAATSMDIKSKFSVDAGSPVADPTQCRSLASALQYLTFTRPYIAYAIN